MLPSFRSIRSKPPWCKYLFGYLSRSSSAGGHFAEDDFLGSAPTQGGAEAVDQLVLIVDHVFLRQVPGGAREQFPRHDGHLQQAVGVFQIPADRSVPGFVVGDDLFSFSRR